MNELVGQMGGSHWAYLVRPAPASQVLSYLVAMWSKYETQYSGIGQPFAERSETTLTEGFAAYLETKLDAGQQPFDGEFVAERQRYDIGPDGKRVIIGRTDIEWRLFGSPAFVIEFKVIGGGRPAKAYVSDGMMRFVDGRYGPKSVEGAMWAFFRPGSTEVASDVADIIDANLVQLRAQAEQGVHRIAPSKVAPNTAAYDSLHLRDSEVSKIRLAHIFLELTSHTRDDTE